MGDGFWVWGPKQKWLIATPWFEAEAQKMDLDVETCIFMMSISLGLEQYYEAGSKPAAIFLALSRRLAESCCSDPDMKRSQSL